MFPLCISASNFGGSSTASINANLTGPITSVGNATSIASQTGTGTKFVVDTAPTISSPSISTTPITSTYIVGAGGVTAGLLVKVSTTNVVVKAGVSDPGILGIALTTQSAAASVEVALIGVTNCVADNTTIIGNILIVGSTTAGRCEDSGQTAKLAISADVQVVGRALTAVAAGANVSVQLMGPGHYGEAPGIHPSVATVIEDFCSGGTTAALVGNRGWILRSVGAAPTYAHGTATWPYFCRFNITTPAVITQGGGFDLAGSSVGPFGILGSNAPWDAYFVFDLPATTTERFRAGFMTPATTAAQPTEGFWIRFDTEASFVDTNFMFCRRAASDTETCIDSGVAADTARHRLYMYSKVAGTIWFKLDAGTPVCMTTAGAGCSMNSATFGTVQSLTPAFFIVTDVAVTARQLNVHYFAFQARGLAR